MTTNDEQFKALLEAFAPELYYMWDLMRKHDIPAQDILRSMYMVGNIKQLSRWGRVIINVKDGKITTVSQEQQFLGEEEVNKV